MLGEIVHFFTALNISGGFHYKLLNLLVAIRHPRNTLFYLRRFGHAPNYVLPETLSDKFQHRKIFDKNRLFIVLNDKIEIRDFVKNKKANVHFPKLLWAGYDVQNIPFDELTPPFVYKPNNSCRKIEFVHTEEAIDRKAITEKCQKWVGESFGFKLSEWAYTQIPTRILFEEYLSPNQGEDALISYKFFCFHGKVGYVQVHSTKGGEDLLTWWSKDGKKLPIRKWIPDEHGQLRERDPDLNLPKTFQEMVSCSEKISENIDHLRVDLYCVRDKIYVGELTTYDGAGCSYFFEEDESYEIRPSEKLNLEYGNFWNLKTRGFWEMFGSLFSR